MHFKMFSKLLLLSCLLAPILPLLHATYIEDVIHKPIKPLDLVFDLLNNKPLSNLIKLPTITPETVQKLVEIAKNDIKNPFKLVLNALDVVDVILPKGLSRDCRNHHKLIIYKAIHAIRYIEDPLKEWSLQLIDAQGKIPSGIMRGNAFWLGDFQECVDIKVFKNESYIFSPEDAAHKDEVAFVGEYCLVSIQIPFFKIPHEFDPQNKLNDTIAVRYGTCFPSSCTTEDKRKMLKFIPVIDYLDVMVEKNYCQKQERMFDTTAAILTVILLIPVMLQYLSTIYDFWDLYLMKLGSTEELGENENIMARYYTGSATRRLLLLFSARKGLIKIFWLTPETKEFAFFHGMRFLSILWIIVGHTPLILARFPMHDPVELIQSKYKVSAQPLANGYYSVDTFLFISGFSFAYFFLLALGSTKASMNVLYYYFARCLRLSPAVLYVICFIAGPVMWLGTGPYWPLVGHNIVQECRQWWWTNVLYISNFIRLGRKDDLQFQHMNFFSQCMFGNWYISLDMQLFIIAVPFVILLNRRAKLGVILSILVVIASLVSTLCIFIIYHLKSFFGFTITVDAVWDFLDLYYYKPWNRLAVYFQGILAGYFLQRIGVKNVVFGPKTVIIGWSICLITTTILVYGTYFYWGDQMMPQYLQVLHGTFSKPLWSLCLMWIVVACATGHAGPIADILSMPIFVPLGRISFCMYLLHGIIIQYYFANEYEPGPVTVYHNMYVVVASVVVIILSSVVLFILVEAPAADFKNVFTRLFVKRLSKKLSTTDDIDTKKLSKFKIWASNGHAQGIVIDDCSKEPLLEKITVQSAIES